MKCQCCEEHDATVHLKQAVNGEVQEMHLCSDCASKTGLDVHSASGITDFLFGMEVQPSPRSAVGNACPGCGMKRAEFQKHTRVGCAACYDAFSEDLEPFLADTQKGDRHVGKVPSNVEAEVCRDALRRRLEQAVKDENYEEAARLRDQIQATQPEPFGAGEAG